MVSIQARQPHDTAPQDGRAASPSPAAVAVMDAAARCFAERGYGTTSIDDVARRLGATKGRVYHHFASKTDLFFHVYRRGMALNFAAIAPHRGDLRAMCLAHAEIIMREQPYQRVLMEGVFLHRHGELSVRQNEALRELIDLRDDYEAAFREAIEAETGHDASIAVKSLLAVLNSTVFWYRERDSGERSQLAEELTATAMAGLQALGPHPSRERPQ